MSGLPICHSGIARFALSKTGFLKIELAKVRNVPTIRRRISFSAMKTYD
jgi:hypothetical protein